MSHYVFDINVNNKDTHKFAVCTCFSLFFCIPVPFAYLMGVLRSPRLNQLRHCYHYGYTEIGNLWS